MFLFQLLLKIDIFQPVKYLDMTQLLCSKFRSLTAIENALLGCTAVLFARGIVNICSTLRVCWSLALVVSTGMTRVDGEVRVCVLSTRVCQLLLVETGHFKCLFPFLWVVHIYFAHLCLYAWYFYGFENFMNDRYTFLHFMYFFQSFSLLFCYTNFFTLIDSNALKCYFGMSYVRRLSPEFWHSVLLCISFCPTTNIWIDNIFFVVEMVLPAPWKFFCHEPSTVVKYPEEVFSSSGSELFTYNVGKG